MLIDRDGLTNAAKTAPTRAEWRCATCHARGSIDVRADASADERRAMIDGSHLVKQPTCPGTAEEFCPAIKKGSA